MPERFIPRLGPEKVSPITRIVTKHPAIRVLGKRGILIGETSTLPVSKVHFYDVQVGFEDSEALPGESIQFYFGEKTGSGQIDDIILVVGTRTGGPRLTLSWQGKRQEEGLVRATYAFSLYWRKINPEDPSVMIASRKKGASPHILDNERDGRGFFSPYNLTIKLQEDSTLLLIPSDMES